jgi:hypothetical protein
LRPSLERGGVKSPLPPIMGTEFNAARARSAEEGDDHIRQVSGTRGNLRGSALWGKPKGESRPSALWGKPGRGFAILALVAALAAPVAATAGQAGRSVQAARALVPASLMADAEAHPAKVFDVIVQGSRGTKSATVAGQVGSSEKSKPGKAKGLMKSFRSVNGVSAELTGAQIVDLAKRPRILAITPDSRIRLSGQFTNDQTWVDSAGVADFFVGNTLAPLNVPAIAIVDSGVAAGRTDFGGRVVKQVTMTNLLPNAVGDGRGHGTFVAGIAAGSKTGYAGAAPTAPIVSIDVMDDTELDPGQGQGRADADRTADRRREHVSRRRRAEREGSLRRLEPSEPESRPEPVRRRRRHGRGCLRLGKLGELGQRKRLLEPGFMESGLVEPGVVGQRLLELSQLEPGFLESGELVLGLLERCQLGSRFLGRGELERGELGSRFLGGVGMVRRTERG